MVPISKELHLIEHISIVDKLIGVSWKLPDELAHVVGGVLRVDAASNSHNNILEIIRLNTPIIIVVSSFHLG